MGRLWNIIKGWWLRLLGRAEAANPEAILEHEMNEFNKARATYNENLAKQAALAERLKGQITVDSQRVEALKARTTALIAGKQTQRAAELALQYKDAQRNLGENKAQYDQAETLYKNLVRQRDIFFKEAQRRIDSVKSKISKAKLAEAQAKLAEIASAMTLDINGTGAVLERLGTSLDERISEAQGKVRVATESMMTDGLIATEAEQKALEALALQEFSAQQGLAPPAGVASLPVDVQHDLGPTDPAADALAEFTASEKVAS